MNKRAGLATLLKNDLRFFVRMSFNTISPGTPYLASWHIDAIVHQLMRVESGEVRRLMINQPPRSLKSICVSVAYVAWLLGHDPSRRIIVASYSNELAAELHRQFRMIIDAPWYQDLFPRLQVAKDSGSELVTTAGGCRFATSVGGTVTGRGGELLVVDDAMKAEEALSETARKATLRWFRGTLRTRLNNQNNGAIIIVAQRLHEDDLCGHLLRGGGWEHLDLPAIAIENTVIPIGRGKVINRRAGDILHPERENKEALDQIRAEIGSLMFSAQYQQRPVPLEGNLIKRPWFRYCDGAPSGSNKRIVQSWDIAMMTGDANDYSVCITCEIVKGDYYILDVYRRRLEYPDLRRALIKLAAKHRPSAILIEDAGPGTALLQDLRRDLPPGMPRPIGEKPKGSKAERMVAQSAKIEAGQVHLLKDADWLDTFLLELLAFPNGRHDDQVDSLSQLLNWGSMRSYFDQTMLVGSGAKFFRNGVEFSPSDNSDR